MEHSHEQGNLPGIEAGITWAKGFPKICSPTAPSWCWVWWGSPSFSEVGTDPPGAGGGIAFCSVDVWDGKTGKLEAPTQRGHGTAAWLLRLCCCHFWGKRAGEGMGPGLAARGSQGVGAAVPSALTPTGSIPLPAAFGTPGPAPPVLCLSLSSGNGPAGPTSVIPAGGTSPAPSLSGGMVAASSNPRSCGGGCGVCDLVGAAPCPGCRGGHGEGSR